MRMRFYTNEERDFYFARVPLMGVLLDMAGEAIESLAREVAEARRRGEDIVEFLIARKPQLYAEALAHGDETLRSMDLLVRVAGSLMARGGGMVTKEDLKRGYGHITDRMPDDVDQVDRISG